MYDDIIKKYADAYRVDPLLLKAVINTESSFNSKAYRFEPEFYDRYIKNNITYKNHKYYNDKNIISASYGLCQIMFTTFIEMGYNPKTPEELYDPDLNIKYGCKLLAYKIKLYGEPLGILAYNSGSPRSKNPAKEHNFNYLQKVARTYKDYGGNNSTIIKYL